jgi:hypothetical protein
MLGIEAPVTLVQFYFNRANKVGLIFFDFDYEERDRALYGLAEALGQDYATKSSKRGTKYLWQPGGNSAAALSIGTAPFNWAYLAVHSRVLSRDPSGK